MPVITPQNSVTFEVKSNHVAVVTINRPDVYNAIDEHVTHGLEEAWQRVEEDPDIWVAILTGAGAKGFCAGADLKAISAGKLDQLSTAKAGFAGFVFAPRVKPWIAAVNGAALGGGCELVLACDMVVASETATFGLTEVARGLMAGAGGVFRIARALPPNIAAEVIATGMKLPAATAHKYGMVNHLTTPDRLLPTAVELAERITVNAPLSVRESLKIARQAFSLDDVALRALCMEARTRLRASQDAKEGPLAFLEKRAPVWRGE